MRMYHSIFCLSLFVSFSCYSMESLKKVGEVVLKKAGENATNIGGGVVLSSVTAFGASWFCKNYLPNKKLNALEKKIEDWENNGFPHNGLKKRITVLEKLIKLPKQIESLQTSNNQQQKNFIASISEEQIKKLMLQEGRIKKCENATKTLKLKIKVLEEYQDKCQKKTDLISNKLDLVSQKADKFGRVEACEKKIESLEQEIQNQKKKIGDCDEETSSTFDAFEVFLKRDKKEKEKIVETISKLNDKLKTKVPVGSLLPISKRLDNIDGRLSELEECKDGIKRIQNCLDQLKLTQQKKQDKKEKKKKPEEKKRVAIQHNKEESTVESLANALLNQLQPAENE